MRLERVTGESEIQSTSFIEPLNSGALEAENQVQATAERHLVLVARTVAAFLTGQRGNSSLLRIL